MPHYKDGRPAKVGDLVAVVSPANALSKPMGILVHIDPAPTSCNAQLLAIARKHGELPWVRDLSPYTECVTLSECLPLQAIDASDRHLTLGELLERELAATAAPA